MATVANALLAPFYTVRGIVSSLGFSPFTVKLEHGAWDGTFTGEGLEAKSYYTLTEGTDGAPRVQQLNAEQIALGGWSAGSMRIGPITPPFTRSDGTKGGTDLTLLQGAVDSGRTVHVVLTGTSVDEPFPQGQTYVIQKVEFGQATARFLIVSPVGSG